jgi:nicotinamide-nucleotide adenylyltransferase/phosphinothricin biosynthesis protein PhpF
MFPWIKKLERARSIRDRAKNPFTYYERCNMIKLALVSMRCDSQRVIIIPEPSGWLREPNLFLPERRKWYIQANGEFALQKKIEFAKRFGIGFELLRDHGTSASNARQKIVTGQEWENLVPKNVAEYLKNIGAEKRLRGISREYGENSLCRIL